MGIGPKVHIGDHFNSLTVIGFRRRKGRGEYECRCQCGGTVYAEAHQLHSGRVRSCGCFRKAFMRTGGLRGRLSKQFPEEYGIWSSMKARCKYKCVHGYERYGGAGISVCERWATSFRNFLLDMGTRPFPHASIDRIDGSANYEPSNCRWASTIAQSRNRKDNHWITMNGVTLCVADWAAVTGLSTFCIRSRLRKGMTAESALTTPSRTKRKRIPESGAHDKRIVEANREA